MGWRGDARRPAQKKWLLTITSRFKTKPIISTFVCELRSHTKNITSTTTALDRILF
jgi:hypothetical protein